MGTLEGGLTAHVAARPWRLLATVTRHVKSLLRITFTSLLFGSLEMLLYQTLANDKLYLAIGRDWQ